MALHAVHHDARVMAAARVPRGCRRSPAWHGIQGEGEPIVNSRRQRPCVLLTTDQTSVSRMQVRRLETMVEALQESVHTERQRRQVASVPYDRICAQYVWQHTSSRNNGERCIAGRMSMTRQSARGH